MGNKNLASAVSSRKSMRLQTHGYRRGMYYITQTTQNRRSVFGTLINGRMNLSAAGQMIHAAWHEIPRFCPGYRSDAFVVMPDHVHGVVCIENSQASGVKYHDYRAIRAREAEGCRDTERSRDGNSHTICNSPSMRLPSVGAAVPTLFDFMHRFKSLTTSRYIHGVKHDGWPPFEGKLWQREYYEHIVRDQADRTRICNYIRDNPKNADRVQISDLRFHGNRDLLKLRKTAFLASRTSCCLDFREVPPLQIEHTDCVISGFLSPIEREVLRWCRHRAIPTIHVLASAFDETLPLDDNQLLISSFDEAFLSRARAVWCNQYVLAHADEIVIGALNPNSMLSLLLSDVSSETPVYILTKEPDVSATQSRVSGSRK